MLAEPHATQITDSKILLTHENSVASPVAEWQNASIYNCLPKVQILVRDLTAWMLHLENLCRHPARGAKNLFPARHLQQGWVTPHSSSC